MWSYATRFTVAAGPSLADMAKTIVIYVKVTTTLVNYSHVFQHFDLEKSFRNRILRRNVSIQIITFSCINIIIFRYVYSYQYIILLKCLIFISIQIIVNFGKKSMPCGYKTGTQLNDILQHLHRYSLSSAMAVVTDTVLTFALGVVCLYSARI